ncbi:MAG: TraB/GumN family protein [Turicibacter sp.]|nr:TraB/GumN family protein [Turicibacter sp.]
MFTKKKFGLLAIMLVLVVGLVGCGEEEDQGIHGAIHRIEYGDNVVYLFGSMHVGAPEWFPLADVVEEAMGRADVFAFEFDFTMQSYTMEELGEIVDMLMGEGQWLPDEQTLADVLPADIYDNFIYYLPTFGVDYEDVYRQNPVGLVFGLQSEITIELFGDIGVSAMESVDFYVLNVAMEEEAEIIGLEPTLQQLRIGFAPNEEVLAEAGFDAFTLEEIMHSVMADFVSRDEVVEAMRNEELSLHEYYFRNDLARINELFQVDAETWENPYGRYMVEVLMNFRSTYYAERIAGLLRDTNEPTTFFVTVGLSHIIREGDHLTNIVEQLDLLGIEAVPIFE